MTLHMTIIGGGFSGAVTAMQALRALPADAGGLTIEIVEPRPLLGAGVAYAAPDPAHRINVPAAKMTVFDEDPAQFDRWLRDTDALTRDPAARWQDGSLYPQRRWFGAYVRALLAQAAMGRPGVVVRHRQSRAVAVDRHDAGWTVGLADGAVIATSLVILAVSHPPPAVPDGLRQAAAGGAAIIADPWQDAALATLEPGASVLIVGTGLTMADVVAALAARGHAGPITAISRRGLLSRGHAPADTAKRERFAALPPPRTALALAKLVRAEVARAAAEGAPWQAVFDDVRSHARRVWDALPTAERQRLVRHLRPFWDVHRFRVAPQVGAAVDRLRERGQLRVLAASVVGAQAAGRASAVTLRRRGGGVEELRADVVVVTTGPAHARAMADNPVLESLARQGLLVADAARLGIEVDEKSRAVGRDGHACETLLVAGPLARGRFGELMGLPQVSAHAQAVGQEAAALMLRRIHAATRPVP